MKFLYPDNNENKLTHIETLRNALNLAIENGKLIENKDIKVLELLLKQIKFEYTVDSSILIITLASGSILNDLNNLNYESKDNKKDKVQQQGYAQLIQKYVRGLINRSKYTGLKNAANKLKLSI